MYVRLEDDIPPVGSEALRDLRSRVRRQLSSISPGGWHDVDIGAKRIAVGGEGDLAPVGRPYRMALIGRARSEATSLAPRGGHGVDIPLVGEGDGLAVGRDGWIAKP